NFTYYLFVGCQHHASHQEVQYPNNAKTHLKQQQRGQELKVDTGIWTSVRQERATGAVGNLRRNYQIKESLNRKENKVVLDSDEETDEGFSCLLIGKGE
ncbi:Unknown protein, partial [Striga hermonthica]